MFFFIGKLISVFNSTPHPHLVIINKLKKKSNCYEMLTSCAEMTVGRVFTYLKSNVAIKQ